MFQIKTRHYSLHCLGISPFFRDQNNSKVNVIVFLIFYLSNFLYQHTATSIPVYVSGWHGHGFESHSQPFMLTYPRADKSLYS